MSSPSRKSGKWWVVVFIVALAAGWWWYWSREGGPRKMVADDPSLIRDRTWVDSKPVKYTDYVHGFIAMSYVPIGFFAKASAYDLRAERFDFNGKGGTLRIVFPQSGKSAELSYTVSACNELPPFDLCLDLAENPWGGPRRYYGLRNPEDEARHLGPLRRRILAHLPQ